MTTTTTREVRLAARPEGTPGPEHFDLVEAELAELGDGQVLVANLVMSVDPYMRGRMREGRSYADPWEVGAAMRGGAVGRVLASRSPQVGEGAYVVHDLAWREHAVVDAAAVRRIDPSSFPLSYHLGVLGMPGLTAYAGLHDVAAIDEGDTVFVSGAAGAVGSVAGQIARLHGCTVIGSAGSPDKVRWLLDELGFDGAFDYHDGPVARSLAAAAPDGIDVYFDNVGGEHLEAAIGHLRLHGRVAVCGMISQYNDEEPSPGPRNLGLLIVNRLTIRGFLVGDHAHGYDEFQQRMRAWLSSGELAVRETVAEGLDQAPDAFLGLFRGDNVGKMLVRLGDDPDAEVVAPSR
ncbi:MAG TPA: NADP-dependent oxidoreductase [Nitriliruptorales bacterium]